MSAAVNPRSIQEAIQPRSGPARRSPAVDLWMILAVAGLITISLVTIAGATRNDIGGRPDYYLTRQGIYFLLGTGIAILIARFDYGRLEGMRRAFWALLIAGNVFVLLFAADTRGSSRWISLPFFQLQPSELGKVLLVIALAGFAVEYARSIATPAVTARLCATALLPAAIVALQPDLGTSLVYVAILGAVLLAAGTPTRHLLTLLALGVVSVVMVLAVLPAAGINVLHDYQLQRLTGFVNPSSDPSKATYQVNQSLIAIGSGQRLGRGEAGSTPTRARFPPRAPHGFHLCCDRRALGVHGCCLGHSPLRAARLARPPTRCCCKGRVRGNTGLRDRCDTRFSDLRKHRYDPWDHADHRSAAAAYELRRVFGARDIHLPRTASVRPPTRGRPRRGGGADEGPGLTTKEGFTNHEEARSRQFRRGRDACRPARG